MLNSNRVRMFVVLSASLSFVGVLQAQDDAGLEPQDFGGYSAAASSDGEAGPGYSNVQADPASSTTLHDASYYVGEDAGTPDFYCPSCDERGLWTKFKDSCSAKMQRLRYGWYYKRQKQKKYIIHYIAPPSSAPNWGYHSTCWRSFPPLLDECPRGSICDPAVTPYGSGGYAPSEHVPPAPEGTSPPLRPVPAAPYDSADNSGQSRLETFPVQQTGFAPRDQPVRLDLLLSDEEKIDDWRPTGRERRNLAP